MHWLRAIPRVATALVALGRPGWIAAQIDYRNSEDRRPIRVEDAYPVERYGFGLSLPLRAAWVRGAAWLNQLAPELEYGIARGTSVGLDLEVGRTRPEAGSMAAGTGWQGEPATVGAFLFRNLVRERNSMPALSARLDAGGPLGSLTEEGHAAIALLATRSLGRGRIHANASWTFAAPESGLGEQELVRWWAGLAADYTLYRTSTLLSAEVVASRLLGDSQVIWSAGFGARRQLTPTLVGFAGAEHSLNGMARFKVNLGLTYAFAVAALMPGRQR